MTDYLTVMYTFLVINGAQLTADAGRAWRFLSGLYEKNQFRFEQLVPWLRQHVTLPRSSKH